MSRKQSTDPAPLFDVTVSRRSGPGPIYQGVGKQIRALLAAEAIDRDKHAGTIAQARSLAASIDRASGHDDPRRQASGMQLAAMHSELRELLTTLSPEVAAADPFQQLLDDMNAAAPGAAGLVEPPAAPVEVEG